MHRDIKPGNIFWRANEESYNVAQDNCIDTVLLHDGVWKIGDFGLAKALEEPTQVSPLAT